MDGLSYVALCTYCAIGGVGVKGADVAGLAVYLADVLCEIPAVGVPDAVFADGEGACGGGLGGVPEDVPEGGGCCAREVSGGDLEVVNSEPPHGSSPVGRVSVDTRPTALTAVGRFAVDVALVRCYFVVGAYLLRGSALPLSRVFESQSIQLHKKHHPRGVMLFCVVGRKCPSKKLQVRIYLL